MTKETFVSQMNTTFGEDVASVMQNGDVLLQYPTGTDYLIEERLPENATITKEACDDGYTEVVIPAQYFN